MAVPLVSHPLRRVVVPVVARVGDGAECRLDFIPTPLLVESPLDQSSDESATLLGTGTAVEFGHEIVVQGDVQPHAVNLAHTEDSHSSPCHVLPARASGSSREPVSGRIPVMDRLLPEPPFVERHQQGNG